MEYDKDDSDGGAAIGLDVENKDENYFKVHVAVDENIETYSETSLQAQGNEKEIGEHHHATGTGQRLPACLRG